VRRDEQGVGDGGSVAHGDQGEVLEAAPRTRRNGRGGDPDHLRPTRRGPRPRATNTIAGMLGRQLPKVEQMLRAAATDITAFADFPVAHWKKIWSTNPLERVNKEIKAPHRRRRGLSQPCCPAPPGRIGARRNPR
jgi:hypothetical protein